jgi:hypothetical protein
MADAAAAVNKVVVPRKRNQAGRRLIGLFIAQAKNEGNEAFKAADYPKAIERYTDALKRGPPGQWDEAYKCFSNRAACFTKLGAMPEGTLPDAAAAIVVNSTILQV